MAIALTIRLSQLEGQKRIDAEYYQPEYCKIRHKLSQIRTKRIKELSTSVVSFGAYSLCNYIIWREKGIPYLNVENIREGYIDWEGVKYIDKDVHEILRKSQVKEGQVIITMAGTIGNAAVAYKLPKEANSNQATAKITLKTGSSPFFLAAFLNSYFGKKQTEWEIVTSVQPNIFLWQIKNIRVPIVSKEIENEVEKFYKQGLNQLELSKSLYSQAENLLLEELGLKDFKPRYKKTYIANLSSAFSAHRIDAEYFQPAYEEVVERIKKYPNGFSRLLEYVENVKPDFDPTKYPEKTFSYVELANIDASIGTIHSVNEIKGEEAPSRAKRILKDKDVIVSSVEGSLEKVALIDKEHNGCLASTGFFQFRPLDILPEVLLILSKTIALQSQFKKKCSGTILTAVPKESLRDIIIPLLPLSTQQKIASLVQESHEARKKAKELLEAAKKAVEIAIENSEEEAVEYISRIA